MIRGNHPPKIGGGLILGLIPAAGASRRMGRDKRLIPIDASASLTVLEQTVQNMVQGGVDGVYVVVEPNSPCYMLPALAACHFAINSHPEYGMLSSIRAGLASLPEETDAVMVLPGDHPFVPPQAITALLRYYREHGSDLCVPLFESRRGHPILLSKRLFGAAAACEDTMGLKQLLTTHHAMLDEVELHLPYTDHDLDTPKDIETFLSVLDACTD